MVFHVKVIISATEGFEGFGARATKIHSPGEGRDSCSRVPLSESTAWQSKEEPYRDSQDLSPSPKHKKLMKKLHAGNSKKPYRDSQDRSPSPKHKKLKKRGSRRVWESRAIRLVIPG